MKMSNHTNSKNIHPKSVQGNKSEVTQRSDEQGHLQKIIPYTDTK